MECRSNNKSIFFMSGMQAVPYIGDLARQADKAIPYVFTALQVVPLLAHEYGNSAMAKMTN